jgi:hypothetical protein
LFVSFQSKQSMDETTSVNGCAGWFGARRGAFIVRSTGGDHEIACRILFRLENPTNRSDTVGDGAHQRRFVMKPAPSFFAKRRHPASQLPDHDVQNGAGQGFAPRRLP